MTQSEKWRFWIDRGGTFTDVLATRPDGVRETMKLLSEDPGRYDDAAVEGIRRCLGVAPGDVIPKDAIAHVKLGTTVATNALLERKGAPTLFVVTEGFGDLFEIGRQTRPRLFDLNIVKPTPLYEQVIETGGRVDLAGEEITHFDAPSLKKSLSDAREAGMTSCAIALVNAWRWPAGEKRVAELARAAGFDHISMSHETSPLVGLYVRASTTVVDAYLSPVLSVYVEKVARALDGVDVYFMKSDGGLARANGFRGKDAVLSGPAGGVVGAARTGEAAGRSDIVAFDMGGTSTDVSVFDGVYERSAETDIAGATLAAPILSIHTVAAGGGSILRFDGGRFEVGPKSAGADPGPMCYRKGGPLTLTDAAVFLGRIDVDAFPKVFGPQADQPIDRAGVATAFEHLAREVSQAVGATTPTAVAEGFVSVAASNMAKAVRKVTLERGRDVTEFTLNCFGGAGGQYACRVADELGVEEILIHPYAGVLSAYGIGLAARSALRERTIEAPISDETLAAAAGALDALSSDNQRELGAIPHRELRTVSMKYAGADAVLSMPFDASADALSTAFHIAHRGRFGYAAPERVVQIAQVSIESILDDASSPTRSSMLETSKAPRPQRHSTLVVGGERQTVPLFARERLAPGDAIEGPALIADAIGAVVVDPGWRAIVITEKELRLRQDRPQRVTSINEGAASAPDPARLALFGNMFMGLAERMGAALQSTAVSVNMKERLDFSCALFDRDGALIANAPHVPVHLGAMGESVRAVIRDRGASLKPGDMIALNDPAHGGTHLPDVTVVAPVFQPGTDNLRCFVANRGHHADIGGAAPGSTPAFSKTLAEEGVVINDFLILEDGVFREPEFRALLASADYPARRPDRNVADIEAQIAANHAGAREALRLYEEYGEATVAAYMRHLVQYAEQSVRRRIEGLKDGAFSVKLDNGAVIAVQISVDHNARSAVIDFDGTSPAGADNFNAPSAVAHAAVLYAFRCLINDDTPLNEGCLRPLTIKIPVGSRLDPPSGAAVVAGNTEVSQVATAAIFGAMGVRAASQSTMNNLLLGDEAWQYYETICGGAGAGRGDDGALFDGADAVHVDMTNTRITDPEIIELRYPFRIDEFSVRRGSGGAGAAGGGDGAIRRLRALAPQTLSLVSSSRCEGPFGLAGGSSGAPGRQWIERADGKIEAIDGAASALLSSGDVFVIETPGGGGYGAPAPRND